MGRNIEIARGFLGRLARDVRGNTIAMLAMVMIPMAGLLGGGVDMSRLYLTKTRLQQACDAGALAGRKAMAAGSWTTGSGNGSTNDKAEKMFAANFASGDYGTGTLTKTYTESNGTVTGTSTVTVPMSVMKMFGMQSRQIAVSCTAKMELPNTDVMFVLDVTYSMQCAPSATSDSCSPAASGSRRIDGLKKAVKCFYEALYRVGTPEPCTVNDQGTPDVYTDDTWSSTGDPTATTSTTTAQVRMGFVPYGVNVNVGKILPNSMVADNWTYQSREAVTGTVQAWTLGSLGTPTWGSWTSPNSVYTVSNYNTFSTVSGSDSSTTTMNDGRALVRRNTSVTTSTACAALNIYNSQAMTGITDSSTGTTGSTSSSPTDQNPPVYPATVQNNSTSRSRTNTVNLGYKYTWTSSSCYLQSATKKSGFSGSYSQTQTGTATKSITWTPYTGALLSWDYKPRQMSVSSLKAGSSSWNTTLSMPIGSAASGPSVTLSGSSTSAQIVYPANSTVTWDGCIEEAQTVQNTDTDPSNEWGSIPTGASDININLIPNSPSTVPWYSSTTSYGPGTYWGPMLTDAVWARYSGSTSSWTQSTVNSTSTLSQSNFNAICTAAEARRLAVYSTNTDFLTYVNALDAQDLGTYHDIGLLWGGRLISPTGIFAADNATASTGGAIQRHLIFMTDGNTRTVYNNYNAYGLGFFNRYQTSYDPVCTGASPYTCTYTDALVNARLLNICTQIKNLNVTLWVISYGSAVNTDTQNRLKQCATPGESLDNNIHFVSAESTSKLTSQFQSIAAKISELRLTS